MNEVLAYHITWTTYGTWLPGDARGWVKKRTTGVQEADPRLESRAKSMLAENAVTLTLQQRDLVDRTIREHCRKREWELHALNARTNHIHVVVSSNCNGETARDQLKGWCSRRLSDDAGLSDRVAAKAGRRRWFTEGGDVENIEDEQYLQNAIRYVEEFQ